MSIMDITKDMIINDVIKKYPQTISVFNRFGVDACCGGGQGIERTATADGINIVALLDALNEVVQVSGNKAG